MEDLRIWNPSKGLALTGEFHLLGTEKQERKVQAYKIVGESLEIEAR